MSGLLRRLGNKDGDQNLFGLVSLFTVVIILIVGGGIASVIGLVWIGGYFDRIGWGVAAGVTKVACVLLIILIVIVVRLGSVWVRYLKSGMTASPKSPRPISLSGLAQTIVKLVRLRRP